MSPVRRTTGRALCLAATLILANAAQAKARPATPAPANTPAAPATPVQPASGPGGPEALFATWDRDHNKVLSLDEFKAGWQEAQVATVLRSLHNNFVAKDVNRNDRLDAAEYANLELIKQAGKSAPPMSAFDSDKNQALDFKEYVGMVDAMMKNPP